MGKVVFTGVCLATPGSGVPHPAWPGGGRYPIRPDGGEVPPSQDRGYPIQPNRGYPHQGGWGYPRPGWMGVPPPPPSPPTEDRAAQRVLATRRAVCLLRSRRSTFLFYSIDGARWIMFCSLATCWPQAGIRSLKVSVFFKLLSDSKRFEKASKQIVKSLVFHSFYSWNHIFVM